MAAFQWVKQAFVNCPNVNEEGFATETINIINKEALMKLLRIKAASVPYIRGTYMI